MGTATSAPDMKTRFEACMILSGVGDAMGYKNGEWEFNYDGSKIHEELQRLGGLSKLNIKLDGWKVSDDTVLNLSTAESLISKSNAEDEELFAEIAFRYQTDFAKDMAGRAGGMTTRASCAQLQPRNPNGYRLPFNKRGGGCGAAMRTMSIGLRFPKIEDDTCLNKLLKVSIESSRMTHNHPTGYLGGMATALFTALAVKHVPVKQWGSILMRTLPKALVYIEESGYDVEENKKAWDYFKTKWESYLELRNLTDGQSEPSFPESYGVEERDAFYKTLAYQNWAGSSGHDAPMIAYDALLAAGGNWEKLCHHGMLHGGDNDSTGVIAGACFGAMYGFQGVPKCNYEHVEYHKRLQEGGHKLYDLASKDGYV